MKASNLKIHPVKTMFKPVTIEIVLQNILVVSSPLAGVSYYKITVF